MVFREGKYVRIPKKRKVVTEVTTLKFDHCLPSFFCSQSLPVTKRSTI